MNTSYGVLCVRESSLKRHPVFRLLLYRNKWTGDLVAAYQPFSIRFSLYDYTDYMNVSACNNTSFTFSEKEANMENFFLEKNPEHND